MGDHFSRIRPSPVALLIVVFLAAAIVWGGKQVATQVAISRLSEAANHRLDLYSASLEGALGKYDYLTGVAALHPKIHALLRNPGSQAIGNATNQYLAEVNAQSGADVLYLLDPAGRVLAASNSNTPTSFVGRDLSYRPYIAEALQHDQARFYGIGTTSGTPGYYFAQAVHDGSERIGVIAVKVSLDKVESTWANNDDVVLVVDANGVVFLASDAKLKFHTVRPLRPDKLAAIASSRQYAGLKLEPLELAIEPEPLGNVRVFSMIQDGVAKRFIELTHGTPEPSWQLILLSDLEPVNALVRNVTAFILVSLGLIGLLMLYLRQRQIAIQDGLAAHNALQRANDELEQKVLERTHTLEQTNVQLVREVAERKHAEEVLREAQNELVHAVKMAALGQMSAGITHELNQPLAALRTLSDNASVLLQRGRSEDVAGNLAMISQLTERMGKITSQLKSFARKSELAIGPVSVQLALENALALLHQPIHKRNIQVDVGLSPSNVMILADQGRLEQVLVNLLMNAIDAIPESANGHIEIQANEHADGVSIKIADNGPGIAADVLPRLFEPFVTSKAPGSGLGLGLTISTGIVAEFGGALRAENRPQGGAIFTLELKSASA